MVPRPRRPVCPRAPRVSLRALGVLAVSAAMSCGRARSSQPPSPTAPGPAGCLIVADSASAATTATAAFEDTTDARRSSLASSRLAPLRLDCEGRPARGLATAWSPDTSGRFWTLEFAPPAAIDSNARWTASTLVATWRADPSARAALRGAGVTSLVPLDDRRLVAELAARLGEVPQVFADRALAVPRTPAITLVEASPAGDLRDAIDQGVDLVHATDPSLLDYARARPGHTTVPLPWNRTYVLLVPAGSPGVGAAIPADTAGLLAELAHEAVRADARPAEGPFWWETHAVCPSSSPHTNQRTPGTAVAYPADDAVARDLAERLVALGGLTARGLSADGFAVALQAATERAYIMGVPRHTPVPCRESAGWPSEASVLPLVDTRPHAVLRRGAPALVVEWDGAVRPAEAAEASSGSR